MRSRDVLAILPLDDGRRWIDAAHQFQRDDALAALEGQEPYNFLTRARGSSKTTDLGAVALSAIATAQEPLRLYWLAADGGQGALAIDAIGGFVTRADLTDRVDVQSRRVVDKASGATLEVLPADAPGAWGLLPHWLFVDELANWTDGPSSRRLWEAASSAVAKRSDARMVVLTTASSPDHFAYKVLQAAHMSELWRVSERHGSAPWTDPARLEEQRQRLPDAVFRQLWLNEWTAAAGSFFDPTVVEAAFVLDGPALEGDKFGRASYAASLDLGVVNDRTVLSIGHRDGEHVVLDRMITWQGSRAHPVDFSEVEETIVDAHRRFGFRLRLDPWQGLDLAQRLRGRGVPAEEFSFTAASKQRLAATLLSTVNAGKLELYEAEGLRDELLGLRLVQSASGSWSFDHRSGGHDDRAVSLSLLAVTLLEAPGGSMVGHFLPGVASPIVRSAWNGPPARQGLWLGAGNGLTVFDGEAVSGLSPAEEIERLRNLPVENEWLRRLT